MFAIGNLTATLPAGIPNSVEFLHRSTSSSDKRPSVSVRAFAGSASALAEPSKQVSLYEVLRVKQNASPMEIKSAYRSLAKLYHPDALHRPESDGKDFIEIHRAYETLSDPSARAMYDLSLESHGRRRRSAVSYTVGTNRAHGYGYYPNRRWETDQCW